VYAEPKREIGVLARIDRLTAPGIVTVGGARSDVLTDTTIETELHFSKILQTRKEISYCSPATNTEFGTIYGRLVVNKADRLAFNSDVSELSTNELTLTSTSFQPLPPSPLLPVRSTFQSPQLDTTVGDRKTKDGNIG
jgi:hypothetical protein